MLTLAVWAATQLCAQQPTEMELWPQGAPTQSGLTPADEKDNGQGWAEQTATARLTVYPAAEPNGMAILMCPGGGYWGLAYTHEGHDMAAWMNAQGITFAVLTYRMPNRHHDVPRSDAEQALRVLRSRADEWKINPRRVGIMGASAGGHLAASVATLYSSADVRPDFQVLFYPVISMQEGVTHQGSRDNLLGTSPDTETVRKYSLETQVNAQTPQAFLMLSADDTVVAPENSLRYFAALQAHGVPASMHIYPTGGHGWGFNDNFAYKRQWTGELEKWLRQGLTYDED